MDFVLYPCNKVKYSSKTVYLYLFTACRNSTGTVLIVFDHTKKRYIKSEFTQYGLYRMNVSFTAVKELSALEGLPLERFLAMGDWTPPQEREAFRAAHPDCLAAFTGTQPFGFPWRYNDETNTTTNFFPYYAHMRLLFLYDDRDYYYNSKWTTGGPGYLRLREG